MKSKKSRVSFFITISVIIIALIGAGIGGYFAIDKILVPKYFSDYGIDNLSELVEIVQTIYNVPEEKSFISNPFAKSDYDSATDKMVKAGFPLLASGAIDYEIVAKGGFIYKPNKDFEDNFIILSDKEMASIVNDILQSGLLVSNFPELSYIDTLQMEIKQIHITSNNKTNADDYSDLNIITTVKLNMESAKSQIAVNLGVSQFLIDLIIPNQMYLTINFDITKTESKYTNSNTTLAINGKTSKQSEVLLNLLISFIYSSDENMTIESLSDYLGSLIIMGFDTVGNYEFAKTDENLKLIGLKFILY